jgi:protein required for attachment to host cells
MQIPNKLPHPAKPTLLVVADTQTAKIFLIKNDELEEIKKIFFEEERASDKEGGFGQRIGGQMQSFGNPPVIPSEEEHLLKDHLLKELNEYLFTCFHNKEFEEWYLVAPDYILNTVEQAMHSYLQKALIKKLAANLVNEPPLDIWERLK